MGKGTFEIERRYLVRVPWELWGTLGAGWRLRQGYVTAGPTSVRIRVGEPRGAVLACKAGTGIRRLEVEARVSTEMAEALFAAAGDRVIEKVRYVLGPWELDRFGGGLEGLALLEIELEREDDIVPEPPGGIDIIREVTDDNQFTSSGLACMSEEAQQRFVSAAYSQVGGC